MTPLEMRYEFDMLYNNIMSDMAPGLDDYEVSVLLTQAQEELVSQLYNGGQDFDGFESTEKVRRNLANLLGKITVATTNPTKVGSFWQYTVSLPTDTMLLVSEHAEIVNTECCNNTKWVNVTPIKYDELNKVLENPFRRPNNRQVLRVDEATKQVSIISSTIVNNYAFEYLKKPSPIVVSNLPSGFSVDGVSAMQGCALDESLHRTIVKYAVNLAAASWASNNKNQ